MSDLQVYQCFKKVRAAEIVRIDAVWKNPLDTERPGSYRVTVKLGDERAGHETIEVPPGVFSREVDERGHPDRALGGFLVLYDDGHWSWSPREAFLAGYRLLGEEDAGGGYIGLDRGDPLLTD